jgi:transposase
VRRQWCIPEVGAEFVWRMEDVLDLYEEPYDPKRPVVCFDELPYQMVAEKRVPISARPGRVVRYDYEYERRGTTNLLAFFEPRGRSRHLEVSTRRTKQDFALFMRRLVDKHYPDAHKVRVVLDNLNTHTPAALYESFEPAEARRIVSKLEFHYTPEHASWLNQVEIEFSVLARECLGGRRIPDEETLGREVGAWERERNERGMTVTWRFTSEDAREKLARLYPARS